MPVYKDKRSNKWFARVNFKDSNGKYCSNTSKGFDTKGEANRCLAEMQLSKKKMHSYITFNDVFREYLEEQKGKVKPTTYSHYVPLYEHVKPFLGDVQISTLTIPQYKQFKKFLDDKGMSTSRKNRCHRFVKTLLKLAYDNHDIFCNVAERVGGFVNALEINSEDEEIKIITKDEFEKYRDYFRNDIVYQTLYTTLFYEGTRIGEALALNWNDIDFDKGLLKITKTYTSKLNVDYRTADSYITKPKTRASIRTIPIEPSTLQSLKELKNYYSNFDAFNEQWFVFGGFKPLSETTITVKKDNALKDLNLNRITIHQFRHSTASYLFEKGIKPTVVQKYLGHSKLSTTMNIYTHLYPDDLMNIHNS